MKMKALVNLEHKWQMANKLFLATLQIILLALRDWRNVAISLEHPVNMWRSLIGMLRHCQVSEILLKMLSTKVANMQIWHEMCSRIQKLYQDVLWKINILFNLWIWSIWNISIKYAPTGSPGDIHKSITGWWELWDSSGALACDDITIVGKLEQDILSTSWHSATDMYGYAATKEKNSSMSFQCNLYKLSHQKHVPMLHSHYGKEFLKKMCT